MSCESAGKILREYCSHHRQRLLSITATTPLTYTWQAAGQSVIIHTGGVSDTASFAWSATGSQTITVVAANADGGVTAAHVITIAAATATLTVTPTSSPTPTVTPTPTRESYRSYLPLIIRSQ